MSKLVSVKFVKTKDLPLDFIREHKCDENAPFVQIKIFNTTPKIQAKSVSSPAKAVRNAISKLTDLSKIKI